ncbi:uncharacterized protein LOC111632606 [Centruroides sculpturatus]|uniref:uncharacterized protein LOC111632606 n=1 Tax=Centruroides sculpturatus TaxID=218467 RepID=UPI000C6DCF4F|nr:uncharacterized protein LOC111632606 [Centruroides sculpturatus]
MQKDLHMVFIDLEKEYDNVPRQDIWRCLREKKNVPEKYVRFVKEMYEEAETQVNSSVGTTEGFFVNVGLHQESALSPYLFVLIMGVLVCNEKCETPWSMLLANDIVLCELFQINAEKKLEDWRTVSEKKA